MYVYLYIKIHVYICLFPCLATYIMMSPHDVLLYQSFAVSFSLSLSLFLSLFLSLDI